MVDLRTTSDVLYSTPAEGEALSFDGEGKLTLYFAVVPTTAEISDWNVGVWDVAGSKYLTASLSAMQLTSGKLYKVSKAKSDFSTSYEISSGSNLKVTAYDAIGLYEWRARASADPTTNVVDLELGADITLPTAGITLTEGLPDKSNWTPVPGGNSLQYKGKIDGKDHTITNMYIVPEEKYYPYGGFVSRVSESTITNLKFDGAKIVVGDEGDPLNSGGERIGVIVGQGTANISDCHVTNSIVKSIGNSDKANFVGGLIGSLSWSSGYGAVTDCSFSGTVEGFQYVGGIVGEQQRDTKIANCSASGTVDGSMIVGGIAGEAKGFIAMCTNEANIKGASSGGIVGNLVDHTGTYNSCIIGCTNEGRIDGTASSYYDGTGGIVGIVSKYYSSHSFIIGCRNLSSEVYKTGGGVNYVAGVVGKFENTTATPTGVYGSYTVTMTVADVQYNSRSVGAVLSGSTAISACPNGFASNADLAADVATMNTQVTNGVTAATTSPRKIYENTYNNYTWTWTSGSWPEFSAPALP
ncbi:MAG: hypothetical protein IIX32_07875 [Alistipes sp.]|nr:hypothetical protein [Alistipes sp.]